MKRVDQVYNQKDNNNEEKKREIYTRDMHPVDERNESTSRGHVDVFILPDFR